MNACDEHAAGRLSGTLPDCDRVVKGHVALPSLDAREE